MKNKLILMYVLFVTLSSVYSQTYSSVTDWYGKDNNGKIIISGKVRIQVEFKKNENDYHIKVQKDITPFSQILFFETNAILQNDKYVFSCVDNWKNEVCGNFKFINDICFFYLACRKYSDIGWNMGRFFGNTHELEKNQ